MTKSLLVTGATGFIGSKLVETLLDRNYHVISLARPGKQVDVRSELVVADLTNSNLRIPIDEIDCVVHLASHTPLERDKKTLEKVNLQGTKNLFSQLKDKTKSIIYISGLGVYGDPKGEIIDESHPYFQTTDFVRIRLEAQKFLETKCNEFGINFSVIHFGDVYGPGGWFYDFLIKRMLNSTFRLPKNGDYYKNFVHRDDAVGSTIAVMERNFKCESFIVADSNPITFREFSNFTADQIGVKHPGSVPVFLAKAVLGGELIKLLTTSMKVSNSKIKKIYDFKYPTYKEGIPQVISELTEKNMLKR